MQQLKMRLWLEMGQTLVNDGKEFVLQGTDISGIISTPDFFPLESWGLLVAKRRTPEYHLV
jgi:hypothetical protein